MGLGIMEKKMETTIVYWVYISFWVSGWFGAVGLGLGLEVQVLTV